jgi:nucleotide-binding universal stress UspA family protein
MSKSIIVGYDPKSSDRAPVNFGVAAARFTGALLLIASAGAGAAHRADAGQLDEDLVADSSSALAEVERELEPEGIAIEYRGIENTSAARALHETAEAEDAGLLVVGSTNRGSIGQVLPGSTADRLMHGAPCPIAIVPHEWEPGAGLNTIGVAYADSDEGREALRGAHALAARAGAKLRVLTAIKAGLTAFQTGRDATDVKGELRVQAEDTLRQATAALGDGVDVQVDAYIEDPADVLIRVSENLDLIVCGSRGYGPLRAVLLGGVSRRLAADARCPVIVLPRGVEGALEELIKDAPGTIAAG